MILSWTRYCSKPRPTEPTGSRWKTCPVRVQHSGRAAASLGGVPIPPCHYITTSVAQNFAVAQISAWWKGEDQGAYLPTGGGDVYGDTTLHGGKSVLFTSSNGGGVGGLSVDNSDRLSIDATGGVKLNGTRILGDQQPAVTDPVGGSVVDNECRAALIALADRIRNHGLIGL